MPQPSSVRPEVLKGCAGLRYLSPNGGGVRQLSSSGAGLAPRNLHLLPNDLQRDIGERLNARSMVAFAATSRATRAAMQATQVHADATVIFPRVVNANSAAEFSAGFKALNDIQHTKIQAEAVSVLVDRFVAAQAALPYTQALPLRSAFIESLKGVRVEPGSAELLAPAVIATFDSIRTTTHAAHSLSTDFDALFAVAPQDRPGVMAECSSVLGAVTPDHLALNDVVKAHGMAALREPMTQLMDKFFDEHSTPYTVQFATKVIPIRLSTLQPSSTSPDHVVDLLPRLAQHATGPAGVCTLDNPQEWGADTSSQIKGALNAHGIKLEDHPVLHAALKALDTGG